jgi:hypothetical protein
MDPLGSLVGIQSIFPLILQGLSFYVDLKDSRTNLRRLVRDLEMERVKFQNTCEYILEDVVPAQVGQKIASGEGIENATLQDALLRCFRPSVATVFNEAVFDLCTTLRGLSEDLGLENNHLV